METLVFLCLSRLGIHSPPMHAMQVARLVCLLSPHGGTFSPSQERKAQGGTAPKFARLRRGSVLPIPAPRVVDPCPPQPWTLKPAGGGGY